MKIIYTKKFLISFFIVLINIPAFAQTPAPCGTDEIRNEQIKNDPSILEREAAFNAFADAFAETNTTTHRSAPYIIPVVFHIIHDYGAENISDAQIYDAIDKINADFSKTNSDFWMTIPEFQGIAADCAIEFRLAQRTLSGACTDGIERIPSLRTYEGSDAAKLEGWQPAFYLNIWVVQDLQNGAAAYAYYPTSIDGFLIPADGIICRYDYVGSIGAAGTYSTHTLSHEIGHYLNLQHCWGNSNSPGVACGDDQVGDTPYTEGWVSCNLYGASCDNEVDNVQNIMEYSYCSTMFTEGQKTRMYATLNDSEAFRNNLWSPENLALTGTTDGYESGLCEPTADFYADNRFVCAGENVNFHDVSWGGTADSRSWEFTGGTPAVSTEINPVVTFSEPGWHKVVMTATNASGATSKSVDDYIYVSSETPVLDETYYGNFNDETEVKNNWVFYNKYADNHYWQWLPHNGYWEGGCAWLNSRFAPDNEKDVLISPSFDLSNYFATNVFFKYSTTTWAITDDDYDMALKLFYSTNCGRTWIYISQITGDDWKFSYGGGSDFFPTEPDQWSMATFNLPSGAQTENVKFKIEFTSNSYSNNVFIDDFNFASPVMSAPENSIASGLSITPNPVDAADQVQVTCNAVNSGRVDLKIFDLSGKEISIFEQTISAGGQHVFSFSPASLHMEPGCYFISLESEGRLVNSKLIVL